MQKKSNPSSTSACCTSATTPKEKRGLAAISILQRILSSFFFSVLKNRSNGAAICRQAKNRRKVWETKKGAQSRVFFFFFFFFQSRDQAPLEQFTLAYRTSMDLPTRAVPPPAPAREHKGGKGGSVTREKKLRELLQMPNANLSALRQLSWGGVAPYLRADVWRILLVSFFFLLWS